MTVTHPGLPEAGVERAVASRPDTGGPLTLIDTLTPRGASVRFWVRDGTNDLSVVHSTALADEYAIRSRRLDGWALDVGAHIGAVTIPLLIDNPKLRVAAIEPVPANVALLASNAEINGVAERLTLISRAAGIAGTTARCSWGYREFDPDRPDYVRAHRFVGNQYRALADPEHVEEVEAVGLGQLLDELGIERVAWLKIDCEGCEYAFLADPAVSRVDYIIGEYHTGYAEEAETYTPGPQERIRALLLATHTVRFLAPDEKIVGLFVAAGKGCGCG